MELTRVSAEDLFAEGVTYALRGDHLRAEQYLGAAKQRGYDPDSIVVWLVRVCVASDRYQAALAHAYRHLRDHPENWWLRFVVANVHDALGESDRAREELELVVRARPSVASPHYRLGVLYRESLGDISASAPHFRSYLRLDPAGRHAREARGYLASPFVGESSTSPIERLP
ncbi:MAG: tetratricopeptide repeat protein [Polyangiales bacterium]